MDTLLSQQDRRRGNQTGLCGGGVQSREAFCVQASVDTPSSPGSIREGKGGHSVPPTAQWLL